jgi:hypothetical protein
MKGETYTKGKVNPNQIQKINAFCPLTRLFMTLELNRKKNLMQKVDWLSLTLINWQHFK